MRARSGDDGVADLDELLAAGAVRCVAVDSTQAQVARDAFARFAPSGLSFGDCFSYALARVMDRPLLFKATTSAGPTSRRSPDAAAPRHSR